MSNSEWLRLVSYNVLADAHIRKEWYPHSRDEDLFGEPRRGRLLTQLRDLQADILAVQEADGSLVEEMTGAPWHSFWTRKTGSKPDGCAAFVHNSLPILQRRVISYDDASGDRPPSGHVGQWLVIEVAGRRLGLYNTHLKWQPDDECPEGGYAMAQARQAARFLHDVIADVDGVVVCGDFNATPRSPILSPLRSLGLRRAHDEDSPTANISGALKAIDHVFIDQRLRSRPVAPSPIAADTPMPGPDHPSDHLPVEVCIAFAAQA